MLTESRQGAVVIVSDDAPLDHAHVEEARSVLQHCNKVGAPMAVFDLTSVPFMDSAGLEFLLDMNDEFRAQGGELKLAAPSSVCRDAMHITGVEDVVEVYDQVGAAVRSFLR